MASIDKEVVAAPEIGDRTTYVGLEHITSNGEFVGVEPVRSGQLASSKFRFDDRHVLFGKLRPYLAKVARPSFEGVCSTDILPLLPGASLDRDFLFHYLRLPSSVAWASSRTTGANLPRLSPKLLSDFKVPVPSMEVQRRIADLLDRADNLRANRRAAFEKLETLKQSIFLDMFGGESKTWTREPMIKVAEKVTVGHVGPTSAHFRDQGILFLRTGNVGRSELDLSEVKYVTPEFHRSLSKSSIRSGDVLISRVISDEVRCAVVREGFPEANCANVIVIRPGERLSGEYLAHLIRQPRSQQQFLQRRVGSAQAVVNTKVLQEWEIPVPPDEVQREFEDRITRVLSSSSTNLDSLTRLDALFASCQSRAFAGEL